MDQIDWSNLTPEQAEYLKGLKVGEQDDYAATIRRDAVAQAKKEFMDEYGPYISSTAGHVAFSKLTEGLSEKAKADIMEKLKEKKVEEVVYLANDPAYSSMLRDAAEYRASKEAAPETKTEIEKGEGTKTNTSLEIEDFKKEMKAKMGVDFTDKEAEEAIKEIKTISVVG